MHHVNVDLPFKSDLSKFLTEPAEKVSEVVNSAIGSTTAEASQKAGELKEEAKGAATNASYEAEKMKAEAGKKANQGEFKITFALLQTSKG